MTKKAPEILVFQDREIPVTHQAAMHFIIQVSAREHLPLPRIRTDRSSADMIRHRARDIITLPPELVGPPSEIEILKKHPEIGIEPGLPSPDLLQHLSPIKSDGPAHSENRPLSFKLPTIFPAITTFFGRAIRTQKKAGAVQGLSV